VEAGFKLGKWGLPVNILAVLWGVTMMINLIWPRKELYNSTPPFEWYLQWGGVIFVVVAVIAGLLLYRLRLRHREGVLAVHAAAPGGAAAIHPEDEAGDPLALETVK
jgi:hypothetical protein